MGSFTILPSIKGESLEAFTDFREPLYASALINFIPKENSIELRKGYSVYFDLSNIAPNEIIPYEAKNAIIVISSNDLYVVRNNVITKITYSNQLGVVTSSIQTNDRLIIFFLNRDPLIIYYNSQKNEWVTEELDLGQGTYFTGAIKYKERLFFYTKGNNTIYYLPVLEYRDSKENVKSYELAGRFGAVGNLNFISIVGYNAGASTQSLMYAVFDSGDILTFSGTNPDDLNSWEVSQKVSTGIAISTSVLVFTDSFLLGKNGLYSLTSILKNNTVAGADSLTLPIKTRLSELQEEYNIKLLYIEGVIYLFVMNSSNHIAINMNTGSIFEFDNHKINSFCVLGNQLLFANYYNNKIFKAFNNSSDNGEAIVGVWECTSFTVGSYKSFRTLNALIDYYAEGNYTISYSQKVDDKFTFLTRWVNKIKVSFSSWDVLENKDWSFIEDNLWRSANEVSREIIKISAGSMAKRYAFRLTVSSDYNNRFNFNKVVINYLELQK